MVTRISLRVHTTAPSTKKDDEKFKAQAEAYGSFVASHRFTEICRNGSPITKADAPSLPQPDMMTINMTPDHGVEKGAPKHQIGDLSNIPYDPTTFLEETQLGYTALESQLFVAPSRILRETSRISLHPTANNIDGSGELENQGSRASRSGEEASSCSHGVPSQSSYLKSPILDRSNKKPRINEENRQYFHTRRSLLPSLIPSREVDTQAAGAISNAAGKKHASSSPRQQQFSNPLQNSIPGDDVTSELPSSYSLSNTTSSNSKDRRQSIRSLSDPGPSPIKAIDPTLAIQVHTPAPSKTSPLNQPVGAAPEKAADPSFPLISPNSDTAVKDFANVGPVHAEPEANTPQALIYPDLPTSIRPPGPTPSLQPFKTHITESLRYLGENPNLAQCYKPVFVSRDLKQSERGCWTFDMTSWPSQLRIDFLQFLIKMIEPGRVGWGVWCVRELDSLEVRVFCWGEVVRHIYLMLYVASKSKVRKLGLKWVDADGAAVVQMRGAEDTGGREKM